MNIEHCSFLMQSRAMKGGPGTTSILVLFCCFPFSETYGIIDKLVGCSVCNSIPVQGIRSYSCKVSCDIQGKELNNERLPLQKTSLSS